MYAISYWFYLFVSQHNGLLRIVLSSLGIQGQGKDEKIEFLFVRKKSKQYADILLLRYEEDMRR